MLGKRFPDLVKFLIPIRIVRVPPFEVPLIYLFADCIASSVWLLMIMVNRLGAVFAGLIFCVEVGM